MNCRTDGERGIALVSALWLLLLVGVIATVLLREVSAERRLAATGEWLVKDRLLADGAVNRVILGLVNPADPLQWRLDGTKQSFSLWGHDVTASVESELGKVDLSAAPIDKVAAVFRALGQSSAGADLLAEHIRDWQATAPADGPDFIAEPYRIGLLAYGPRHGAFRSGAELHLIDGMSEELYRRAQPLFTIYTRQPTVDLPVATDRVLAVLDEAGDPLAASQHARRETGDPAGSDRRPGLGEAVTIRVESTERDVSVSRRAVIRLTGNAVQPFLILAWE